MAYTTNPKLPRLRMQAVLLVRNGWSTREVARHLGYNQSTIVRWVARAPFDGRGTIPTLRSRPKSYPSQLSEEIVAAIVEERLQSKRCAEVIHQALAEKGVVVSLSSVKRTLARNELLKSRTKWKRKRLFVERPAALAPGDLVQVDTIHFARKDGTRFYVYTLIDLYSRAAHAEYSTKCKQDVSFAFVMRAQKQLGFRFQVVQADNGTEFQTWFRDQLKAKGIVLRHSRVRQSNDNAHIERFNRTLQDECLGRWPLERHIPKQLKTYLPYYNQERMHLGIQLKRPAELLAQLC